MVVGKEGGGGAKPTSRHPQGCISRHARPLPAQQQWSRPHASSSGEVVRWSRLQEPAAGRGRVYSPVIGTAPAERDTKPDKSKVQHQRRRFVSTSAERPAAVRLRRGGWRTSSSSSRRRLRRRGGGGGEGARTGPAEEASSARGVP